ncbi:MAG: DNA primase [Enterobacteriaceae bacterium]
MTKPFPFSHLMGRGANKEEEEEEEKAKKGRKAEDDKGDDKKTTEDQDDNKKPDSEDNKDDKQGDKKSSGDGGGGDGEDDDENKDVKKGRKAERARCAAIFGSQAAAGKADLAATLAFNTNMSAKEAITVLASLPASNQHVSLDQRMASVQQHHVGQDSKSAATGSGAQATADSMISLYNRINQGK